MKKILFVIIHFLILTACIHSQLNGWFWQHPMPTGNGLNSVYFLDNNNGWAVGNCGTILMTKNGGVNWTEHKSKTTVDLNSVHFLNHYQ